MIAAVVAGGLTASNVTMSAPAAMARTAACGMPYPACWMAAADSESVSTRP